MSFSPHYEFLNRPNNGGLKIDFLSNPSAVIDQLAAFSRVNTTHTARFDGTVIRIPLRTEAQSITSKIINLAVTPETLLEEFEMFQNEVVELLLFLKNIERIEFQLDCTKLGTTKIVNLKDVRDARASVKSTIALGSQLSFSFQMEISSSYNFNDGRQYICLRKYHIHHRFCEINRNESVEFQNWAVKERVFPWVALAAPLSQEQPLHGQRGRIFVSLPLPIFLEQTAVNVHGMFALSRDRRSLWSTADAPNGGRATNEILWNRYLFKEIIPIAWKDMLLELTHLDHPLFEYFPLVPSFQGSSFESLMEDVLDAILATNAAVWYSTTKEFMSLANGYLAMEMISETLLDALQALSMPIIAGIPSQLIPQLLAREQTYISLDPKSVRKWFRKKLMRQPLLTLEHSTVMELLHFSMKDKNYVDLHGLPLFLCKDNHVRSLSVRAVKPMSHGFNEALYVATTTEVNLFGANGSQFLDLALFPEEIAQQIQDNVESFSSLMTLDRFDLHSFRLYANDVLFSHVKDSTLHPEITISECDVEFTWIQNLWKWLDLHGHEKIERVVDQLHLIPLEGNRLHRVRFPLVQK